MAISIPVVSSHIRPLDPKKDLIAVADLIDICFSDQMDDDGREYVRHIRTAAKDWRYLHRVAGANEIATYPLHGYVWEEDNKVVGNLTLLPYNRKNKWIYMIVNVAVHPDYRRRGIARQLTIRGLDHIKKHGAASAWLQVRDDNQTARDLYQSLGFIERACRSTWFSGESSFSAPLIPEIQFTSRRAEDWVLQSSWLKATYPQEVSWHLPFDLEKLRPGLWISLKRFLNGEEMSHWAARYHNQLIGTATWEPTRQSTDAVWLAVSPRQSDRAIRGLLAHVRRSLYTRRHLSVNYPAGLNGEDFMAAGFSLQNTLIWMEKKS
jgi:ribosomal protein S18 acetylase RimI-like enzyme